MTDRYTFREDADGHSYLLPVEKVKEFEAWLALDPESEDFDCDLFEEYYANNPINTFSFEDPRRDQ